MSTQSLSIVLAERPKDKIIPGKTFHQKTETAPSPDDLKDGEVLVETLYLSLDPAMRGWLNDARSYMPPVKIGEVMRAQALSRVLASRSSKAKKGDLITTFSGWRERAVVSERQFQPPIRLPPGGHPTDLLGVLGSTGLTAYFGLEKIGRVREGDTVVVSGAAGAVGSVVGQIARIQGAGTLVGIAGSEEKLAWLRDELGFDVVLNYKDKDFRKKFKEATPKYVDVYWDNVGGEVLDLALGRANRNARFVMCGGISQYNTSKPQGPKNISNVISQRILMQGFLVFDYADEYPQATQQLAKWLGEGKIKRKETIVKGGLKAAENALLDLFDGKNTGKLLVEVKNPGEASKL